MYGEMTIPDFEKYLSILGQRLLERGETYDIVIIGGFALMQYYALNTRGTTRDIDFGYYEYQEDGDNTSLMFEASKITKEYGLDDKWFNCDSGAHLSPEILSTVQYMESYGGLNIYVPSAEAILAMKTISARTEADGTNDYIDIPFLVRLTGIGPSIEELEDNAQRYMPEEYSYRYTWETQGKLIHILTSANLIGYNE